MSDRPQVWVFAGPNGAGKSTLAERFLRNRLPNVNPDVIAQSLPKRPDGSLSELEAGRYALTQRRENIKAHVTFAFETTLSGASEILTMRSARQAGFKVNLLFVGLESANKSALRVGERVKRGGHNVPPEAIQRRYERAMSNFGEAAALADRVVVFDNSGRGHRLLLIEENGRIRHHAPFPEWAKRWLPARYQT